MARPVARVLIALCVISLVTLADSVSIVPLDELALSPSERALLNAYIVQLEQTLADSTLGSLILHGANGWDSSVFATYTGGSLAERGYEVRLASGLGVAGDLHAWVLVGLPVGSQLVWIPIDAAPTIGTAQRTLGTIPWENGGTSNRNRFHPSYTQPVETHTLPYNRPPVAEPVRLNNTVFWVGGLIVATALKSFDLDGDIVLYRWCLDDAACESASSWRREMTFETAGHHRIALFVVDQGGRSASTTMTVLVIDAQSEVDRKNADCGCGG
jgi:hypothetical protein